MSIWRNCRTAVIFKSIVSPHATCELKRMCFPEDIQCLTLSCRFLGRCWNFLSAASWLIHQQQFRGTEDAACWEVWLWKLSVWARRSLWFVRILSGWLPCTQSKKKRFLHTERTQQVYLWYFFFQLLLVTRAKSLTTGTVSVSVFSLWQV